MEVAIQHIMMNLKTVCHFFNNGTKMSFYRNKLARRSVGSYLNWEPLDKEIHTGQKWRKGDFRLARFIDKSKLVNPNWAVKLIAEVPPIPVKGRITCCDGGTGPTGHPKVYINLDKPGNHSCLYCGLRYYKEDCH